MNLDQAYDQLRKLIDEHGTARDYEALDDLWIATGRANEQLGQAWLLDQQSRVIRKRQRRTITGAEFNAGLERSD